MTSSSLSTFLPSLFSFITEFKSIFLMKHFLMKYLWRRCYKSAVSLIPSFPSFPRFPSFRFTTLSFNSTRRKLGNLGYLGNLGRQIYFRVFQGFQDFQVFVKEHFKQYGQTKTWRCRKTWKTSK